MGQDEERQLHDLLRQDRRGAQAGAFVEHGGEPAAPVFDHAEGLGLRLQHTTADTTHPKEGEYGVFICGFVNSCDRNENIFGGDLVAWRW